MSSFGDLFGAQGRGTGAESFLLWGVAYGFVQSLLAPVFLDIQQHLNILGIDAGVHQVLSPADLASMVVKNIVVEGDASGDAAASGITANDFQRMVENTGEPPGLETVLEMWRRQFIGFADQGPESPSVERAILTSRIYDYWSPIIEQMAHIPVSPADAVEAVLKGQRPQPDMETEAYASGIDAERFQLLLDTAGDPPGPSELVELLRRKLIPLEGVGPTVTSFQQGIFEGRSKDKWWPLYADLAVYVPPPRSIATLQSHGVIDEAKAAQLYQDAGLTPELAGIYAASAVAVRVAAHTQLTETNVLKLYYNRLVDAATATTMLGNLGISGPTAAYLLELQDFNRAEAAYNSAVSRIGSLYVGRKITRQSAVDALGHLDVPAAAVAHLFATWDAEVAADVKPLTAAEVDDAFYYQIISQDEAIAQLVELGYTPHDAWVKLSIKAKGALPNPPGAGAPAGEGTPTV